MVQALLGEGVDTVFGISGSHVLSIYDALRDAPQIRHVTASHENNAALMAEAYARVTGKPGVALVTAGPGATNAVSGIAQAYTNAAPVILVSGSVPLNSKKETFHGVDDPTFLHRIFSPVTKLSVRVEQAEDIYHVFAHAFSRALSGRPGPVHVEIDPTVLNTCVANPCIYAHEPRLRALPDQSMVARIVDALRRAERPVIVAGKGVLVSRAAEELAQLAELLTAPVVFPQDALGCMSHDHPLCVSFMSTMMGINPLVIELLNRSDAVFGIGLRPNASNLGPILHHIPNNLIFVGFDDLEDTQEGAALSCVADPKMMLQELIPRLSASLLHDSTRNDTTQNRLRSLRSDSLAEIARNKQALLSALHSAVEPYREKAPMHFGVALAELVKHLPPNTIVVSDVGNHAVWTLTYLMRLQTAELLQVGDWAAMGYATPGTIGAKIANSDRPVVGITGDGSFLMSCAEFATAVQNRLRIIYVILHDGRHGMVEKLQLRDYRRVYATEINPPDFAKYAESFGAVGIRVEQPCELGNAFLQAFAADGPVIVDVICDSGVPYVSIPEAAHHT